LSYSNEYANASAIGSERLRKAIERNRAKQFKRDIKDKPPEAPPSFSSSGSSHSSSHSATSSPSSRRMSVATKPEEVVVIERPKSRKSRLIESPESFISTSSRKLANNKYNKWLNLENLGYAFILLISLRLVFADRGIIDYLRRDRTLSERSQYHQSILKENKLLSEEINRIEKDQPYQKQLVRDLLGFIGNDETLLVFAGE
jgi:cell division protein FtsB